MDFFWIVFSLILVTNGLIALFLAVFLLRRPSAPGRTPLIWMLIMLAAWAFCYAMITISPTLEEKRFWLKLENLGIQTVPVFWFFFTLKFSQTDKWLNKFSGALFFIIPSISLVFLFNPNWFHFFYSSIYPVSESGGPLVIDHEDHLRDVFQYSMAGNWNQVEKTQTEDTHTQENGCEGK